MDIGIDLGTTFSVIAVDGQVELVPDYPPGIYLEECDVTIIPTPFGESTFPSVVWEDPDAPGAFLFGSEALQKADEGYAPAMFTKRKIGTREHVLFEHREVVAKDVAREFLGYLKFCAEQALGKPVNRAVVTHPAYFDRGSVEETREAAAMAGFDMSLPEQMLMEPVAAALAYTRTDKRDPLRVLTYDLGGGTFDVTYLERNSGIIEMKAFDGNHLMGGYNFDRELVRWVRKRLEEQGRRILLDENSPEDRGRIARLLRVAESVKISLAEARTDSSMVEFRVRDILVDTDGLPVQVNERISREQFVDLIRPCIDETVERCMCALEKAGVSPGEVDEVLLVGGSTYGPWIAESVSRALGDVEPKLFFPDLCVGAGAAIHARMVLPILAGGGEFILTLDVPETSSIDVINIGGIVASSDGGRVEDGLSVSLSLPDAGVLGPVNLGEDGSFLFEDVELLDGMPSSFSVSVFTEKGARVLQHDFRIVLSFETSDVSGVTSVLPRPLFIETVDGLVPLAEEGAVLPSRCEATFQRENDNPNISLRLFHDGEQIGEIRVEDIPPEGGRGSYVDLSVEITEKNQIRGLARVRTRLDKVVAQSNVRVRFEPANVPEEAELRERFEELKCCWRAIPPVNEDVESGGDMYGRAGMLVGDIERLLDNQPLERQEVYVALRKLQGLLKPPEDDMNPTRQRFCEVVAQCRSGVENLTARAKAALAKVDGSEQEEPIEQRVVAAANRDLRRAEHFGPLIDRLEREGLAAHEKRDHRGWARFYDALTSVVIQVQERPDIGDLPTMLVKMFSSFEVMSLMGELDEREGLLCKEGRSGDWQGEVDRIRSVLNDAMRKIDEIDDSLPSEQGRAQVRLIFGKSVDPVKKDLKKLGVGDIRRLGVK